MFFFASSKPEHSSCAYPFRPHGNDCSARISFEPDAEVEPLLLADVEPPPELLEPHAASRTPATARTAASAIARAMPERPAGPLGVTVEYNTLLSLTSWGVTSTALQSEMCAPIDQVRAGPPTIIETIRSCSSAVAGASPIFFP